MAFPPAAPFISKIITTGGFRDGELITSGHKTNDTTPLITGTGRVGTKIKVYVDGKLAGKGDVNSKGEWKIEIGEDTPLTGDGTKKITATAYNSNGESLPSDVYELELVTTRPDDPQPFTVMDITGDVQGVIEPGSKTDEQSPLLTGTGQADYTVIIRVDGKVNYLIPVSKDGTWSYGLLESLPEGDHFITIQMMDEAGNLSRESDPFDFIVEVNAVYVEIEDALDNYGPIQGAVLNHGKTDDLTPTLRGNARPDATLTLYDENGNVLTTFRVGKNGQWSYELPQQEEGRHTYRAEVVSVTGTKAEADFTLTIDRTPPVSSAYVTAISDDSGTSSHDFITNDQTLIIRGDVTAPIGDDEKVQISIDGSGWLETTYDRASNSWQYDYRNVILAEGEHNIRVRVIDDVGNIGAQSEQDIYIDLTPPTAQSYITAISDDTNIPGDFVTTDQTLIIHGKVSGALGRGETVQISFNGVTWFDVDYDAASKTWVYDNQSVILPEGRHTIYSRVTDLAGNIGETSQQVVTIDTSVSSSTSVITGITDDTGADGHDFITSDQTLIIHGVVEGNLYRDEKVQVSFDGSTWFDVQYDASNKTWSYDNRAVILSEGAHTIYTRIINSVGSVGGQTRQSITVDITAPTAVSVIEGITEDTGQAGDFITNARALMIQGKVKGALASDERVQVSFNGQDWVDATYNATTKTWFYDNRGVALEEGTHRIHTRIVDKAGNAGSETYQDIVIDTTAPAAASVITGISDDTGLVGDFITSDQTLVIYGKIDGMLAAGERVQISFNGRDWLDANFDAATKTWSYDNSHVALSEGTHRLHTRILDAAGNAGSESYQDIQIDTTAPTATSFITGITDDTGLPGDFMTTDQTLVIFAEVRGELAADERVQISLDNGASWLDTVYNATNNRWELDNRDQILAYGDYVFKTRVIDRAGNFDPASIHSQDVRIIVDKPTNWATIEHYIDDFGPQQGKFYSGSYTDDQTPTLHGRINAQLKAGEQVALYRGTTFIGYATVDAKHAKNWSFTDKGLESGNAYVYTAAVVNESGGAGPSSGLFEIRVTKDDSMDVPDIGYGEKSYSSSVALGQNGEWIIVSDQSIYKAAGNSFSDYTSQLLTWDKGDVSHISSGWYSAAAPVFGAFTLADYNNDGLLDLFTTDRDYWGSTGTMFLGNGNGTLDQASLVRTGTPLHMGGVVTIDMDGDGYLDVILGDSGSDSMTFLHNRGKDSTGYWNKDQWDVYGKLSGPTASSISKIIVDHEVSTVDLNNDGAVDFVGHAYKILTDMNSLKVLLNDGSSSSDGSNWIEAQTFTDVFNNNGALDDTYNNTISLTWGDYNGDGYLDLYLAQGRNGSKQSYDSVFLYNNGYGALAAPQYVTDGVRGKTSVAVDWNGDGKMDIIELPDAKQSVGDSLIYINSGSYDASGRVIWDLQKLSHAGYMQTTDGRYDAQASKDAATGATVVDYDWDGSLDLVISTMDMVWSGFGGSKSVDQTQSVIVNNPNKPEYGTALHLRILNADGSNTFYGNTVQLFDSRGELVSTQIINAQSGSGNNDGTGLVHFYGLDRDETYSAVMFHNKKGASNDFGGLHSVKGPVKNNDIENYNASWGHLKAGEAHDAYVLTAEADTNVNIDTYKNGIVGTGYNDTFFAMEGIRTYNGGGGWSEFNGVKKWSATGGSDNVDFKLAGDHALNIDLGMTGYQNTGFGIVQFINIEGISGANGHDTFTDGKGDNVFNGRGGDDTYNLFSGGHNTLLYEVIDHQDGTGGNGHDLVNGFTIADYFNSDASDRIDLSGLLMGYEKDSNGPAHHVNGVAAINGGDTISEYLSVKYEGNNTVLYLDRDGSGDMFNAQALITLTDVHTDLATLLANQQIVL